MKIINYILIFYYSFGALIPQSDFSQIAQIDDLIRHYRIHQAEADALNQKLSFWDFLYLHFGTEEEHQHENPQAHDNLPLKKIAPSHTFFLDVKVSLSSEMVYAICDAFTSFYKASLEIEFVYSFFHPPAHFIG